MSALHSEICQLLVQLEQEIKALALWSPAPPSAQALASQQPFCVDTLTFPQWLQYVFLPQMGERIATGAVLPLRCGIAPMAEEYCAAAGINGRALISLLQQLDVVLTTQV